MILISEFFFFDLRNQSLLKWDHITFSGGSTIRNNKWNDQKSHSESLHQVQYKWIRFCTSLIEGDVNNDLYILKKKKRFIYN